MSEYKIEYCYEDHLDDDYSEEYWAIFKDGQYFCSCSSLPIAEQIVACLEIDKSKLKDAIMKMRYVLGSGWLVPRPGSGAGGMTIEANIRVQ